MVEKELWEKTKRRLGWGYINLLGGHTLCYCSPRYGDKNYIRVLDPKFVIWYEEMENRYG
jgi:hypothetical protein